MWPMVYLSSLGFGTFPNWGSPPPIRFNFSSPSLTTFSGVGATAWPNDAQRDGLDGVAVTGRPQLLAGSYVRAKPGNQNWVDIPEFSGQALSLAISQGLFNRTDAALEWMIGQFPPALQDEPSEWRSPWFGAKALHTQAKGYGLRTISTFFNIPPAFACKCGPNPGWGTLNDTLAHQYAVFLAVSIHYLAGPLGSPPDFVELFNEPNTPGENDQQYMSVLQYSKLLVATKLQLQTLPPIAGYETKIVGPGCYSISATLEYLQQMPRTLSYNGAEVDVLGCLAGYSAHAWDDKFPLNTKDPWHPHWYNYFDQFNHDFFLFVKNNSKPYVLMTEFGTSWDEEFPLPSNTSTPYWPWLNIPPFTTAAAVRIPQGWGWGQNEYLPASDLPSFATTTIDRLVRMAGWSASVGQPVDLGLVYWEANDDYAVGKMAWGLLAGDEDQYAAVLNTTPAFRPAFEAFKMIRNAFRSNPTVVPPDYLVRVFDTAPGADPFPWPDTPQPVVTAVALRQSDSSLLIVANPSGQTHTVSLVLDGLPRGLVQANVTGEQFGAYARYATPIHLTVGPSSSIMLPPLGPWSTAVLSVQM